MRIVLSNASKAWGGVHRVTEVLARGLQLRGHEVFVYGRPGSMLQERMRGVAPFEPILKGMDLSPRVLWRTRQALKRHRPDVVIALMKKDVRLTVPVARMLGIATIVRHANDQPLPPGPRGRLLYGGSATHVTNAEATRRTILASAPWLAPERVEVIHNGLEPAPFETAEPVELDLPPGAVRFGYVGSFEPRKGLRVLAEAWRSVADPLPDAHLLFAGKGTDEAALKEMLGGVQRVHWLGYRRDVPNVMRALDVLVLPSFVEGAPNVVQEAMAAGIAVIATAVSGTPELVRSGEHGLLVPPGDAPALASAIARLAGDAELRARLAAAGHARVRAEFTLERMLDRYEALLARVVAARR
ncbi:MAG TPA: glycosyltransferase family 4 protein [Longimicrobium sp.]|nr:glycosyltransferase family 4 protein [Longimicrobium sp.]